MAVKLATENAHVYHVGTRFHHKTELSAGSLSDWPKVWFTVYDQSGVATSLAVNTTDDSEHTRTVADGTLVVDIAQTEVDSGELLFDLQSFTREFSIQVDGEDTSGNRVTWFAQELHIYRAGEGPAATTGTITVDPTGNPDIQIEVVADKIAISKRQWRFATAAAAEAQTGLSDGEIVTIEAAGLEGQWKRDASSTATDDGVMALTAADGGRLLRLHDGLIYAEWWIEQAGGLVGSGASAAEQTANTTALQAAINYESKNAARLVLPGSIIEHDGKLYFYYDATNNTGWADPAAASGSPDDQVYGFFMEGAGMPSSTTDNTPTNNDATYLWYTGSDADPYVFGSGNRLDARMQVSNMGFRASNTGQVVKVQRLSKFTNLSNIFVLQESTGGGMVANDVWINEWKNIFIEYKGTSGASRGVGFTHRAVNQSFGMFTGHNISASGFLYGFIIGEVNYDAAYTRFLYASYFTALQASNCGVGLFVGNGVRGVHFGGFNAEASEYADIVVANGAQGVTFANYFSRDDEATLGNVNIGQRALDEKTFTSGQNLSSGTSDSKTGSVLVDSAATFQTDGVAAGDSVWNKSTDPYTVAIVSVVDSETQLTLDRDAFDDDGGETYQVYDTPTDAQKKYESVVFTNPYLRNPGYYGFYVSPGTDSRHVTLQNPILYTGKTPASGVTAIHAAGNVNGGLVIKPLYINGGGSQEFNVFINDETLWDLVTDAGAGGEWRWEAPVEFNGAVQLDGAVTVNGVSTFAGAAEFDSTLQADGGVTTNSTVQNNGAVTNASTVENQGAVTNSSTVANNGIVTDNDTRTQSKTGSVTGRHLFYQDTATAVLTDGDTIDLFEVALTNGDTISLEVTITLIRGSASQMFSYVGKYICSAFQDDAGGVSVSAVTTVATAEVSDVTLTETPSFSAGAGKVTFAFTHTETSGVDFDAYCNVSVVLTGRDNTGDFTEDKLTWLI